MHCNSLAKTLKKASVTFSTALAFMFFATIAHAAKAQLPERIHSALVEQILSSLNNNELEVEISMDANKAAIISKQEDQIANIELVKPVTNIKGGNFNARIIFDNDKTLTAIGRYTTYIQAPMASHFLKQGTVLSQDDVNLIRSKFIKLRGYRAHDNLVGMQTKRNISAGSLIKPSDLTAPTIIHNNDLINIVYSSGSITVKTSAIALQNGGLGEIINVKNQKTGAILSGTVINHNTVDIGK